MKYSPKPKNKKLEVASIVLIITSVVMFYFAAQSYVKLAPVVQFLGVCTLGFAAYFLIRRITVFTYIIMPQSGEKEYNEALLPSELAFVVSKKRGQNGSSYLCQLDLGSLRAIEPLSAESSERNKQLTSADKTTTYRYTATISSVEEKYLLEFSKVGHKKINLVLELDDKMSSYLKTVVELNKKNSIDDE